MSAAEAMATGSKGAPRPYPFALRDTRFATWGLGLIIGLAVSWHVLLEPGVIGLVHDWSIPPFGGQNIALLHQMFDGWYRWGLGLPIAYPLEYPLRLVLALLGACGFDGAFVSKAIVVLVPASSFVALTTLARACGLSQRAAWLGGAFYALDPVMLNKLVSGQATYLLGYAILPLIPAVFLTSAGMRRALPASVLLGALLALAAVQVQLGVIACAILVSLAALSTHLPVARRAGVVCVAFAVLAVIELPTLTWLVHGVVGLEQLNQFGHRAAWLQANSIAPADAVRLIGYLAHYDISATFGWTVEWEVASWVVVAAVAVGLVALPGPMRAVCIVAVVLTIAFVGGTATPLGPAITWLFEHVPIAQMFRELYHAMAVVSLAYALAIAACWTFVSRLRYRRAWQGAIIVATGAYVAPMLSGDISGWLQAAPVDSYLAAVYHDVNRGAGRVAWFPLDQPLAFDNYGAGVDPMAVTERGSLWLYSLTWPLTAVDMTARSGDDGLLRDELRTLGVAVAVNRDRLTSRYDVFSAEGSVARRLFRRPLEFGPDVGTPHVYAPGLTSYDLPGGPLSTFVATNAAVVPQRLAIISALSLRHVAAFDFAHLPPAGVTYQVYYDLQDRAWEALQVAGLGQPFDSPDVDATHGFAGGDVWWWYRKPYADAAGFSVAIGSAETRLRAPVAERDARVVVAWIATPAGGELDVRCGGARRAIDTGAAWSAWRSTAVDCGALPLGATVELTTRNANTEVALRGVQIVDGRRFAAAEGSLDRLLRGAVVATQLTSGVEERARFDRPEVTARVEAVVRGRPAVLEIDRATASGGAAVTLKAPDGYVVAWRPFASGQRTVQVPFVGDGTTMSLHVSGARVVRWRLARLGGNRRFVPRSGSFPRGAPTLIVVNQTFNRAWQLGGATGPLPTALGTNVFVLPALGGPPPEARFAYSAQFRVAFILGALTLALALALGLWGLSTRAAQGAGRDSLEPRST